MDRTSPRDLARADEKQLLRAGREVLAAEVTGRGRTRWNHYFPKEAAVHVYRRFRIQAAIARRDRSPERAVVHLVWAGTDRGGTHRAGRTASIRFVKEPARTKGDRSWAPTR